MEVVPVPAGKQAAELGGEQKMSDLMQTYLIQIGGAVPMGLAAAKRLAR